MTDDTLDRPIRLAEGFDLKVAAIEGRTDTGELVRALRLVAHVATPAGAEDIPTPPFGVDEALTLARRLLVAAVLIDPDRTGAALAEARRETSLLRALLEAPATAPH